MTIEVVEDSGRLREFSAEWEDLLERVAPPTPFQTPQWLVTWWEHFGSGKLHVLVFREDSCAVGVLPCFLHVWNGRKQLTLIGAGMSDYLDPTFDPRFSSEIVAALDGHLRSNIEWEICDWQDLSADSPLRSLGSVVDDTPCSRAPLAASFEEFMAARPHGLKRNLRRYGEKAQAVGTLRFDVTETADPVLLTALINLHRARWQRSGEPGMIESNGAEAFLREVAKVLAAANSLRFLTLHFDERVAAIILALRNDTTIFSYLSAFDPEFEVLGCGRELLARSMQYAHLEGYRYWNFLRGDEPYKLDWGAQLIPKCRLILNRAGR